MRAPRTIWMSKTVLMTPSRVPICDPTPSANSIKKKMMAQNGAAGNSTMACVKTIKTKPVPSTDCV